VGEGRVHHTARLRLLSLLLLSQAFRKQKKKKSPETKTKTRQNKNKSKRRRGWRKRGSRGSRWEPDEESSPPFFHFSFHFGFAPFHLQVFRGKKKLEKRALRI
jgi:hypothetical protein